MQPRFNLTLANVPKIALALSAIAALGIGAPPTNAEPIAQRDRRDNNAEVTIPPERYIEYDRYFNPRFEFSLAYPENLVSPQAPPQNNDGRTFVSPEGDIEIKAFGYHNSLNQPLSAAYQRAARSHTQEHPTRDVTYKTRGENWFVVSGYQGNDIFYTKTILRDGKYKVLSIRYDLSLKPKFDPIVAEIAQSFNG
jgi:hypothetical protein